MEDFTKMLEREKHLKVYYFFWYGEFQHSVDADNPEDAIKEFLKIYTIKDFDYLLEYDKKHGYYITYRYDEGKWVKRFTPSLRHQK